MLIIADERMPMQAKARLEDFGDIIWLSSKEITYDAISGHPDIFFCNTPGGLVYAPNTPFTVVQKIAARAINLIKGNFPLGSLYPATAHYNAFLNTSFLIHNTTVSDKAILESSYGLERIHINQGYTRCSLVEAGGLFITADHGIEKVLNHHGLETFLIDQSKVRLQGFDHGFFGGCTGIWKNKLFIIGNLRDYNNLAQLLKSRNIEIVELYDGPLWDGGSIIFLE
jgi:hypothetical protein